MPGSGPATTPAGLAERAAEVVSARHWRQAPGAAVREAPPHAPQAPPHAPDRIRRTRRRLRRTGRRLRRTLRRLRRTLRRLRRTGRRLRRTGRRLRRTLPQAPPHGPQAPPHAPQAPPYGPQVPPDGPQAAPAAVAASARYWHQAPAVATTDRGSLRPCRRPPSGRAVGWRGPSDRAAYDDLRFQPE